MLEVVWLARQPRSLVFARLAWLGAVLVPLILAAVSVPVAVHAANESAAPADTITPPANGAPAPTNSKTLFKVTGTDGSPLRLRDGPGLNATVLARLAEGSAVTLLAGSATQKDGERWLPVQSGDVKGWSAARYLVRVVPLSTTRLPNRAPSAAVVVPTGPLSLRKPAPSPLAFEPKVPPGAASRVPPLTVMPPLLLRGTSMVATALAAGS